MTNFKLEIPLSKSYTSDNGEYHLAFSISTTEKDLQGDIISEKALESMLKQAKGLTINANHQHDLNTLIGPVVDAWIEKKDDITHLWVDVHVRQKWVETIKDLVDSGVRLGGSIEGKITEKTYNKSKNLIIEDLHLIGAALTHIPANKATLGTATSVSDGCPGSMCMQLSKQLNRENIDLEVDKLTKKEKIEEKSVTEDKNDSITMLASISGRVNTVLKKITNKTDSEETEKTEGTVMELQLQKAEEHNTKLEKELIELKAENMKLKDGLKGIKNIIIEKKHDNLVNKALKLNKKLDPNTKIVNKELLLKEVKALSTSRDNRDVYVQLESYITGLKLALKSMHEGDVPKIADTSMKSESKYHEDIKRLMKEINEPLIKKEE